MSGYSLTYNGKRLSVCAWARIIDRCPSSIYAQIREGKTAEQILGRHQTKIKAAERGARLQKLISRQWREEGGAA